MAERPIIFSAPMVRAILGGRKTMTRRIVRLPHQNPLGAWEATTVGGDRARRADGSPVPRMAAIWHTRTGDTLACPYGLPGDRLWVRETWAQGRATDFVYYRATDENAVAAKADRWRPSIHMPRWASRITLEVTGVRVERVQEISEADCMAEGIQEYHQSETVLGSDRMTNKWCRYTAKAARTQGREVPATADDIGAFAMLWDSVNGPGAWDRNDWVWCVEFRPL